MSFCFFRSYVSWLCWLIWVLWGMSLCEISGRGRNAYTCLFLCLVQYGTRGKCPSFSCKDFFLTVLPCRFMLMSVFNTTLKFIPCQSNNMQQAWQCRRLNHDRSEGVGFGVHPVGSNCIYQYGNKEKPYRPRHNRTVTRIRL